MFLQNEGYCSICRAARYFSRVGHGCGPITSALSPAQFPGGPAGLPAASDCTDADTCKGGGRLYDITSFYFCYSFVALVGIIFFTLLLPRCRPYPYTDEWIYVTPLKFHTFNQLLTWSFAQHVDHRIPLQRASNYLLLRIAMFDFRFQVAMNFILALFLTVILLNVSRRIRGFQSVGDLCIPLISLSLCAGFSVWGFHFQFLSSIFFLVAFLAACALANAYDRPEYLYLALFNLAVCALCGLNGLIASSVAALVMLAWLMIKSRQSARHFSIGVYASLIAVFVVDASLWLTWTPSLAAHPPANVAIIGQFIYGMLLGSLGTYSFSEAKFKFLLLCVLFIAGGCQLLRRFASTCSTFFDMGSAATVCASLAIVFAVAVGRSTHTGGWNNVLTFHYGYLIVLIPIVSWIVCTSRLSPRICLIASLPVILLFGMAFIDNAKWRFDYSRDAARQQSQVVAALQKNVSSSQLAQQYILDFYYIDTPQTRSQVAAGLAALRSFGAPLYGREPKGDQTVIVHPPSAIPNIGGGICKIAELDGFQEPENWGVWSKQDPAKIKLEQAISGRLTLDFTAYTMNDHRAHDVTVTLDHQRAKVTLLPDVPHTFSLTYNLSRPAQEILLSGIAPISPAEAGLANDPRKLAIGLVNIDCIQNRDGSQ